MKWLFGKNYPLWVILVLFCVILYLMYLLYNPYKIVNTALKDKNITILNGKPVICVDFYTQPIINKQELYEI